MALFSSIRDYIEARRRRNDQLVIMRRNRILKAALNAKALIQLRIQERGVDADNKPFVDYTPDYKKRGRIALGYQGEYVDFTRTGDMWRNIKPVIIDEDDNIVVVSIKATNDLNEKKLRGFVKKRGNILVLSDDERKLVTEIYRNQLLEDFNDVEDI